MKKRGVFVPKGFLKQREENTSAGPAVTQTGILQTAYDKGSVIPVTSKHYGS